MATHNQVVENWLNNKKSKSGVSPYNNLVRLETDGYNLWSFNMLIGITTDEGKFVLDVNAGIGKTSNTTKRHYNIARAAIGWTNTEHVVKPILSNSSYSSGWSNYQSNDFLVFPKDWRDKQVYPPIS